MRFRSCSANASFNSLFFCLDRVPQSPNHANGSTGQTELIMTGKLPSLGLFCPNARAPPPPFPLLLSGSPDVLHRCSSPRLRALAIPFLSRSLPSLVARFMFPYGGRTFSLPMMYSPRNWRGFSGLYPRGRKPFSSHRDPDASLHLQGGDGPSRRVSCFPRQPETIAIAPLFLAPPAVLRSFVLCVCCLTRRRASLSPPPCRLPVQLNLPDELLESF